MYPSIDLISVLGCLQGLAAASLSPQGRRALAQELSVADASEIAAQLNLESRIHEFTLSNGLRFVILEVGVLGTCCS